MKNFLYVLLFAFLIIFSVKSWREKAIAWVLNKPVKGVTLEQLQKAQGIQSYASENLKVSIYGISEFTPKTPDFKLKDDNMHYLMLETSIENLSNTPLDAGWFNTTYFVEDDKGHLFHCYLDELTGYYEEKQLQKTAEMESYYGKEVPPKTTLPKKYFFFPMPKGAKPLKVHFDDPLAKTQHVFSLQ